METRTETSNIIAPFFSGIRVHSPMPFKAELCVENSLFSPDHEVIKQFSCASHIKMKLGLVKILKCQQLLIMKKKTFKTIGPGSCAVMLCDFSILTIISLGKRRLVAFVVVVYLCMCLFVFII